MTWAAHGGSLEELATTDDTADDMPGAELREEEKGDFIDTPAKRVDVSKAWHSTVLHDAWHSTGGFVGLEC